MTPQETFLALNSTDWTAIGAIANVACSLLTTFLVGFAYFQITGARQTPNATRFE
jgi:hypothetical protein